MFHNNNQHEILFRFPTCKSSCIFDYRVRAFSKDSDIATHFLFILLSSYFPGRFKTLAILNGQYKKVKNTG